MSALPAVRPGARVKILDFGLARAVAGDGANITRSGDVLGTPPYMSPEQVDGEMVDARSDLFSLGCVLYRLCTGDPPFQGQDTQSILKAVALADPLPSSSPGVPIPSGCTRMNSGILMTPHVEI